MVLPGFEWVAPIYSGLKVLRLKRNGYAPKPAGLSTKSRITVPFQALHNNHNMLGVPTVNPEAPVL